MINPERGEVWQVDLNPTIGDEMGKRRPVIVISENSVGRLALRVIVPITDWKERYSAFPWMTQLVPDGKNGLSKPSSADAFQIRSLSVMRFVSKLGKLSVADVDAIAEAIVLTVGYTP